MIQTGQQVGPYLVLGPLGEGGMGTVFRARDTRLDREVALKMLPPEFAAQADRLARFRQEALAIASLNHPNVATIYGFEEPSPGTLLLVLEKVEGDSLAERLEKGALPIEESLRVCAQVAEALEVAHERGVIHRDIKPGNVMVGARGLVKVLDFGLAEKAGSKATPLKPSSSPAADDATIAMDVTVAMDVTIASSEPPATAADGVTMAGDATVAGDGGGAVSGTPGYMSPEQIRGAAQDARTDAFAFGCLLYECLTGRRAFPGAPLEAMKAALFAEPDYARLPERTPSRIRALLVRLLTKDLEGRLPNLKAARLEIEDALGIRRASALMAGEAPEVAPNNLPKQASSFVGRQDQIEACIHAMATTRLLTLTGVGGSGKTRLALKVADVLLAESPDGVWFVDLAPVSDPERVVLAIATAAGVREEPGQPLIATLRERFAPQKVLLLLDNCEHLITSAAATAEMLLDAAPELRIIATSREALSIPGEILHGVPTLALPPTDPPPSAEQVVEYESARLFVERGRQVRPDFALTDADAPILADLCRRLDGIPLAIELAAARLRVLGVKEIRAKLDDRFRLLTGGSRTALPRHQTLRATIQWSYDQLTDEEKHFLRALAAFTGGWTLETATRVVDDDADEFEVLDQMTRLVEKSLAVVDRVDAGTRYRFLETVRQFALEELNTAGEGNRTRDRHLATFEELALGAESALLGREQVSWLTRLESEHGNLLAALDWCATAEDGAQRGLAIASSLSRFWTARGYFELGWSSLKAALDRDTSAEPTPARGKALVRAGGLALYRGDYAGARPLIEASLAITRAEGDEKGEARALSGVGTVATYQGDFTAAKAALEESIALYRKQGNKRGEGIALHNLGYIAVRAGDPAEARRLFDEALATCRSVGDYEMVALTLSAAAVAALRRNDLDSARGMIQESLDRALELGAKREGAYGLEAAAELARAEGRPVPAARLSGASEALRKAMGSPLIPIEEEERKEFLGKLEGDLGPAALSAELASGRGLGFADAVALAREGLPGRLAP